MKLLNSIQFIDMVVIKTQLNNLVVQGVDFAYLPDVSEVKFNCTWQLCLRLRGPLEKPQNIAELAHF